MDSQLRTVRDRFHLLCRFCLSDENCIPIFTGEYELNEQLSKTLDILLTKVDQEDGLPNLICHGCVAIVERFVDFESMCVRSYDLLERALREAEDGPPVVDAEMIKSENLCIERTADAQPEEEFLAEETVEPEDTEILETLEDQELVEHLDNVVENIELMVEDDLDEPSESTSYNLTEDQQKMLDAAMDAQPCGYIERSSRKIPLVQCIYCKNTYRGRNTLKKHLKIHLNIKDYRCAHCPRTFTDRSSLRIHEGRHGGKLFECSQCGKTYFSQNELRQHLTMQHLERKFSCDTCHRKFPSKTILNDHQRVHLDDRPFVCQQCGCGFKRNRNLTRHQLLHQKETKNKNRNDYVCSVCTDSYETSEMLLSHLREQHPDDLDSLQLQCSKCDMDEFNDLQEYLEHQQTHRVESITKSSKALFHCGECTETFRTKKLAHHHLKVHEGDGTFFCDRTNCRTLFSKRLLLDQHMESAHSAD